MRLFKHKDADLIFAAEGDQAWWIAKPFPGGEESVCYGERDGESFVANGIYGEIDQLPDWATPFLKYH